MSGFAALLAITASGCAETDTGEDDAPDTGTSLPATSYDGGTPLTSYDSGYSSPLPGYDAGYTPGGGTTTPPRSDAGSPSTGLPALGSDAGLPNLFGDGGLSIPDIFGGGGDASAPRSDAGSLSPSDPMCQGAICFDVFDCYLFSPDKFNCGFTACDLGTCK